MVIYRTFRLCRFSEKARRGQEGQERGKEINREGESERSEGESERSAGPLNQKARWHQRAFQSRRAVPPTKFGQSMEPFIGIGR
jgi:hypothetical protein